VFDSLGRGVWGLIILFGPAVYVIIGIEKRLVGHRLQGATFRRERIGSDLGAT
jgi:hypothetical protein